MKGFIELHTHCKNGITAYGRELMRIDNIISIEENSAESIVWLSPHGYSSHVKESYSEIIKMIENDKKLI